MPGISERSQKYQGSPVRKLSSLLEKAATSRDIISFGGGAPSLAPPKEAIDYVCSKLNEDARKNLMYTSTEGMPRIRQLLSDYLKTEYSIDVPSGCVSIGLGTSELLFAAFQVMLEQGDEAVVADPCFVGYPEPIKLTGAALKWVKADGGMHMDANDVAEAVTKKTKAIILTSPDNPTGRVETDANVKGIVELCDDKDIWLITDDVYSDIIFDGKFTNSRRFGGYDRTLSLLTMSKSCSMPGIRTGFAYGPKPLMDKINEIKQGTSLAPSTVGQLAIEAFFRDGASLKRRFVREEVIPTYRKRRDAIVSSLRAHLPEAKFHVPEGAFYIFPDMSYYLKKSGKDAETLSNDMLGKKGVAFIPGNFFGPARNGYVRMTFVTEPPERIEEGVRRIAEYFGA